MYSEILVALDGSRFSLAGGRAALMLAVHFGCRVAACHVYDAGLHSDRFQEMEPILPEPYQSPGKLAHMRATHGSLINEGFRALSAGYMESFLGEARAKGVPVEEIHVEGRNYVELLRLAGKRGSGLITLGAHGLGDSGDGMLGGTAVRVLRGAPCDVYIARNGNLDGGGVITGIDGGAEALEALRKAVVWARATGGRLEAAAVYDPFFHYNVFRAMADSMSPERQQEVGLAAQEDLHEKIIDDGLEKLYRDFLDEAGRKAEQAGVKPHSTLLKGKAYRALADHAQASGAGLLVAGRFGRHRRDGVDIGSNAEALARSAATDVLITSPAGPAEIRLEEPGNFTLEWDPDAETALERVPSFARPMARRAIEDHLRKSGSARVTLADFNEVARRFGMGRSPQPGTSRSGNGGGDDAK